MYSNANRDLIEFVDSLLDYKELFPNEVNDLKQFRKIKRILNELNLEFVEFLSHSMVASADSLKIRYMKSLEDGNFLYSLTDHKRMSNWTTILQFVADHLTFGGALNTAEFTTEKRNSLQDYIKNSKNILDSRLQKNSGVGAVYQSLPNRSNNVDYDFLLFLMIASLSKAYCAISSTALICNAAFMSIKYSYGVEECEFKASKSEIQELKNALRTADSALKTFSELCEVQKNEINSLSTKVKELKKLENNLNSQLTKKDNIVSQLEKQLFKLKEELKSKEDKAKTQELKHKIRELTMENVKLKNSNNSLLAQVVNLEQKLESATITLEEQRLKLLEYQEEDVFLGYIDSMDMLNYYIKNLNKPKSTSMIKVRREELFNVLKGQVLLLDSNGIVHKVYQQYHIPQEVPAGYSFVSTDIIPRDVEHNHDRLFQDTEKVVLYSEKENKVGFMLRFNKSCRNNDLLNQILCPPNIKFSVYFIEEIHRNKIGTFALLLDLFAGTTTIVPIDDTAVEESFIAYSEDIQSVLYTWVNPFQSDNFKYWNSKIQYSIADSENSVILLETDERVEVSLYSTNYFRVGDLVKLDSITKFPVTVIPASKMSEIGMTKNERQNYSRRKSSMDNSPSIPVYMKVGIVGNPYYSASYKSLLGKQGIDVVIAEGYDTYKSILRRVKDCDLVVFCPTFMSHEVNYTLKNDKSLPNVLFSKNDGANFILNEIKKWEENKKNDI